jgi:hypothetical protein
VIRKIPLAVAVAIFIALRLPLFFDPALHLGWNSDAALFGLIAKAVAAGRDFPIFFWGQSYMGPLTSYIAAPLIWLMHPMRALRLAASLEVLAGIVFYWLGLRRAFDERVANAVAILLAISPVYMVHFSIATIGGEPLFFLSSIVFWFAQTTDLARPRHWLILGVLGGFGWWIHQGIIFALAAAVIVKIRWRIAGLHRPRSSVVVVIALLIGADAILGALRSLGFEVPSLFLYRPLLEPVVALVVLLLMVNFDVLRTSLRIDSRLPLFVVGFGIGYLPVIIGTFRGAVLKTYGLSVPPMPLRGTLAHAITFVRDDLWMLAGGGIASLIVIVSCAIAIARRPRFDMPLVTIVLCILFYLFSSRAYPGTVRYIVPALPMIYAFAVDEILRIRAGVVAVLAVAILLLIPAMRLIREVGDARAEVYGHFGGEFDPRPVLRTIESQGYTVCYAEYWVAYKLQWVSDERVRFIPYHSYDRTREQSRALAATPGRKCFVDRDGRVSEFRPRPDEDAISNKAREHLREMNR